MKNLKWNCTDLDRKQYGIQLSDNLFKFKEWDEQEQEFVELEVDINKYSTEEIDENISAYYGSVDEIKSIYGIESNFIIAECIFEQESGLY